MELSMIKLQRPPKPKELTPDEEARLTEVYRLTEKRVWREDYILDPLLSMTHSKCAYCETRIAKDSIHFHIDHLHPKKPYMKEVIRWENLLPSCGDCNNKKHQHDTYKEPIVNPTESIPAGHLCLDMYRIKGTSELGKCTETVLQLNRSPLPLERFNVGNSIHGKLEQLYSQIQEQDIKSSRFARIKARWYDDLATNILSYGLSDKTFSATIATIILTSKDYAAIKTFFQRHGIWDAALSEKESVLVQNRL
jgi:hypothetical protein